MDSTTSAPQPPTEISTMDILAAAFFVVAGAWLLLALLYSTLVLLFLRMRARGELSSVYDEDFGRIYLCGSRRFYLPFGCIFRRYLRHLHAEAGMTPQPVHFMTRTERRMAMEKILLGRKPSAFSRKAPESVACIECCEDENVDDDASSSQEPLCSICLGAYEKSDTVFESRTCVHQFHEDCILNWLQRQANTECPCCREPMADEEDVWTTVQKIRKQRRRDRRKQKAAAAKAAAKTVKEEPEEISETIEDADSETYDVTYDLEAPPVINQVRSTDSTSDEDNEESSASESAV